MKYTQLFSAILSSVLHSKNSCLWSRYRRMDSDKRLHIFITFKSSSLALPTSIHGSA
jgi:hypothetical protein